MKFEKNNAGGSKNNLNIIPLQEGYNIHHKDL